ncbi:MAG: MmgE/PrpD family protein [Betaproteobacteria bacterium]|nr:MmgE/PrpD family protein [Betaproteobacteria bacterium]
MGKLADSAFDTEERHRDEVGELIGNYVAHVSGTLDARAERAAKAALIDSFAVAIAALRHPAAQNARKHAYGFATSKGCVLWGTPKRVHPELAALANGVLLRCHDYNDFFVGRRNSGHSSDILSGVIAAAEWTNASGKELLSAVAVGYEMVGAAFDAFSTAQGGWDYTTLMQLGATAGIARVLGLNADQTREAMGMTVVPHYASDEIESGELNRRGDLSMWKRFNGADAVRNALQACLLAQAGVEAAVRPFGGDCGFIRKMNMTDDPVPVLKERLNPRLPLARVSDAFMKRWPVGSVAQSAIQAAIEARSQIRDLSRIKQIRVFAEEGAYDHLVKIRQDPWNPISRETADHSLPYIVAAAVLDGTIAVNSFTPKVVLDPKRQAFIKKVVCTPALELGSHAMGKHKRVEMGYLSRVEIELDDGKVVEGAARPFPGHHKNPFSDADLNQKLRENVEPIAGAQRTAKLTEALWSVDKMKSVRDLTKLLAFRADIDSARVRER